MILFLGVPSEPPLALAIEAALEAGIEAAVWNQRDAPFTEAVLSASADGLGGYLQLRDGAVALEAVRGVYPRLTDPEVLPEANTVERRERARAVTSLLNEWLELTPARVLNRAAAGAANMSKPYQAGQLMRLGWAVPETLITTEAGEVAAFQARVGRVIYKSISGVRSIVTEFPEGAEADAQRLRMLPTQFQAHVPGVDVRVHVVGDEVFATEISSGATDYRYASRSGEAAEMAAIELPPQVAELCRATARALDLMLCGIDLRRRPDGVHVAFEVNPSPAYSWYQQNTGQPIAQAIVAYLNG